MLQDKIITYLNNVISEICAFFLRTIYSVQLCIYKKALKWIFMNNLQVKKSQWYTGSVYTNKKLYRCQ